MKRYDVAAVVGYHPYAVREFQDMLESFQDLHCYIQHLEQFTSSAESVRRSYDAIVFYMMQHESPSEEKQWYEGDVEAAMNGLGQDGQGIVILHHSLLAFENWPEWKKISGLDPEYYRDYQLDVNMNYYPRLPGHPIMKGVKPFSLQDEAYICDPIPVGDGMEVLLTTDSEVNMEMVAWTNRYRTSRVFCYQSGHGAKAFCSPDYRRILRQGILWTIGEDKEEKREGR